MINFILVDLCWKTRLKVKITQELVWLFFFKNLFLSLKTKQSNEKEKSEERREQHEYLSLFTLQFEASTISLHL